MTNIASVGLAAATYPVERMADWPALGRKIDGWVASAATEGARILVMPEYAGTEAALIGETGTLPQTATDWCLRSAEVAPRYVELCAGIAQRHGVLLLSGSLPCMGAPGLVMRAHLHGPDGSLGWQDKQILTPWERAHTPMVGGEPLGAYETEFGRVGILICYDAEFPALAAALSPDLLLIPSCTETRAGLTRVRVAARARALEQQCVAVHAPLIGTVPDCLLVDETWGQAGIFGPPDTGFPDTGILASGAANVPGWSYGTLDAEALALTRTEGRVAPRAHAGEAEIIAAGVTGAWFGPNRP